MKDNWKEETQAQDLESKLTLYVMGEADSATCREVESALLEDEALRMRHQELQSALALLRQPQMQPLLGEERRAALRAAAGGSKPPARLLRFPGMRMAAALLVFGGIVALWQKPWEGVGLVQSQSAALETMEDPGDTGYAKPHASSEADHESLWELGYGGGGGAPLDPAEELVIAEVREYIELPKVGRFLGPGDSVPPRGSEGGRVLTVKPEPSISLLTAPASPSSGNRRFPEELVQLEQLGYASNEADTEVVAAERVFEDRSRVLQDEVNVGFSPSIGQYDDLVQQITPICVLTDGYGRRYQDAEVLRYLHPAYPQETARDMFFRFYGDNPEVFTRFEALSTFAADVDTASYPLVRNYLVHDQLPPKAAIRTEEFLNYFDYSLAAPQEEDFAVQLQATQSRFGGKDRILLSIGIKAREVQAAARAPMNLVFVIDKSGSMAGKRMQLVKDALMLLVDQIRDTDTLGLVTFDSTARVVLDPTPGTERYRIREAIRSLGTGGSTNAAQGIQLGYRLIEQVYDPASINRVILASDGVANTGETDQERILKQVQEHAEAKVDLTTLGVGMGNHNDTFLEQLADRGNGSCHYLDDLEEAKRVLVEGFLGTMITVARDVKIQVEFDPQQVLRWRQLGYENRSLAHQDFRRDEVDAGEVGSGHEVVALYEVEPTATAEPAGNLVTVRLRWKPEGSEKAVEREYQLDLAAGLGRWGLAPVRLREMAVVAQFAEVLRRSRHAQEDSYEVLQQEAARLAQELPGEHEVVELHNMIRRTKDLARWAPPQDDLSLLLEEARRQRLLEAELALAGGGSEVEDMLEQVRRQNRQLEDRLQEMLQRD